MDQTPSVNEMYQIPALFALELVPKNWQSLIALHSFAFQASYAMRCSLNMTKMTIVETGKDEIGVGVKEGLNMTTI